MSLADAGLSVRTTNTLEGKNIFTVSQLATQSREDLLDIGNFGESTLGEVRKIVDDLGVEHPNWKKPPRARRRPKKSSRRA